MVSPSYPSQPVKRQERDLTWLFWRERLVDNELCIRFSVIGARAFTQNWNSEKNLKRSIISDNFHGIRGCLCEKFHDGFH